MATRTTRHREGTQNLAGYKVGEAGPLLIINRRVAHPIGVPHSIALCVSSLMTCFTKRSGTSFTLPRGRAD
jgi:hypothetical protein